MLPIDSHGFIPFADDYDAGRDGTGDATWRSAWFYASMAVLGNDPKHMDDIARWAGQSILKEYFKSFLYAFRKHCCGPDRLFIHPDNHKKAFSRDQLLPLLYCLSAVPLSRIDLYPKAREILMEIVRLDEQYDAVSPSKAGKIRDNIRYILGLVCKQYDVKYSRKVDRCWFDTALAVYAGSWMWSPSDKLKTRPYAIFNNIAAASILRLHHGEQKYLRKMFEFFSDLNFGLAYDIVAGKHVSFAQIHEFKHKTAWTNDIINQRGPYPVKAGEYKVLDWPILLALKKVWG